MVRLLFWIALIAAAFWLWRKFKVSQQSHPEAKLDAPLQMVRCAHCGSSANSSKRKGSTGVDKRAP